METCSDGENEKKKVSHACKRRGGGDANRVDK